MDLSCIISSFKNVIADGNNLSNSTFFDFVNIFARPIYKANLRQFFYDQKSKGVMVEVTKK